MCFLFPLVFPSSLRIIFVLNSFSSEICSISISSLPEDEIKKGRSVGRVQEILLFFVYDFADVSQVCSFAAAPMAFDIQFQTLLLTSSSQIRTMHGKRNDHRKQSSKEN